ncbi:MAG: hypothetical protein ACI4NU_04515 [Christensenellales bacterium]
MTAVILLSAAGIGYCAVYFAYCIRRARFRDTLGAAALCLLSGGALLFALL